MLRTAKGTGAHVVSGNVQCFSAAGPDAVARFNGIPWTLILCSAAARRSDQPLLVDCT